MSAMDHAGATGGGSRSREVEEGASSWNDEEAAHLLPTEHFEVEDRRRPGHRHPLRWLAGPSEPRRHIVKPFLPSIQRLPIQLIDRFLPGRRYQLVAFAVLLLLWISAFVPLLLAGGRVARDKSGSPVVNMDCTDSFWLHKNLCGPDGVGCMPFSNISFSFRCPPGCAAVQLLEPRAIGSVEAIYRPLVVGGEVYRGDSWTCASAIHAGIFSNANGGCASVSLVGQHSSYPAVEGHGGLRSIGFDSYFPLSYTISEEPDVSCPGEYRGTLLVFSLIFTATLSLFAVLPSLVFFVTVMVGLVQVGFVSDPPNAGHDISVLPLRISSFAGTLLPAMFCLVILYRTCIRPTLLGLDAQIEKTMLWVGGFWFGALSNYTFGWVPIQRLTAHDLEQQPGAKSSLAVILIILVLIVAQQIYYFWLEGRLPQYLALYSLFLAAILFCLAIPSVELRLHHYIIGLLLLPGTSMQTRPSLLYQGLLLGLFVNGIGRWGFASVLETPDALRGDGAFGSVTPVINPPSISLATFPDAASSNISFTWEPPPPSAHIEGISALVNDVERLRHFFISADNSNTGENFTWTRPVDLDLPEYFRFAFIKDGITLDYTKAGTWAANGRWDVPTTT